MGCTVGVNKLSVGVPWGVSGAPMGCAWVAHGVYVGPWIAHELAVGSLWGAH